MNVIFTEISSTVIILNETHPLFTINATNVGLLLDVVVSLPYIMRLIMAINQSDSCNSRFSILCDNASTGKQIRATYNYHLG
jgi:hypothetical protein